MILNLLHRATRGTGHRLFVFQQDVAHELGLKVTLLIDLASMYDEAIVGEFKRYAQEYGDELGIWFVGFGGPEFDAQIGGKEVFIWLYPQEQKRQILDIALRRFRQVFGHDPVSVGSYHFDAGSLQLLRSLCPAVKIAVAGCFEEGVRVFHGCNNSWYLFNEGMPWWPWYPSKTHALRPAVDADDAVGIVAVPHLCRDLVLSYEGRNDYFATHPGNVQRAMAYVDSECPYMLNLVDQHRLQEDYNEGYSYCHVFVGAGWLAPSHNVPDPEEISKGLYREFLEYFVALRQQGLLTDMTMSEFADWYRENVPIGKPQVALAKDVLYGSGKHYFWYVDPYFRVLVDATQGGSIGDLRPYAGQVACVTGPDTPNLCYASYPYVVHSQHRSGIAHHFADGAHTTLKVTYRDETVDLGTCRTRCAEVKRDAAGTHVRLTPAAATFRSGLTAAIETIYHFVGQGDILITRRLADVSDPDAVLQLQEYFKGCYGRTEYPEDMHGVQLQVEGDTPQSIEYEYRSRTIETANAQAVIARIPQVNTGIQLEAVDAPAALGQAVEGYLFNPYYTLALQYSVAKGGEVRTWLRINKLR
jgi:hypothetical protein